MATRLGLYNEALNEHLGERSLATIAEDRAPRHVLDGIWDRGFVDSCLEAGQWNFAMRTAKLSYSTSIEPAFGYKRAFDYPTDLVRVVSVCSDEYFKQPILNYQDEAAYWFCDYDEIYIRYVSNDSNYGNDIANWPPSFSDWAAAQLAQRGAKKITQSKFDARELKKEVKDLLVKARSIDAMKDPTRFPPAGRWTSARRGRGSSRNWDSVHAAH